MKDNFSDGSDQYARYRPAYPDQLFDFLESLLQGKEAAWDCGTGNGQVAYALSKIFQEVFATDISQSQLDNAAKAPNIHYSVQPAEHTRFEANQFHLITIAQAIHWFQFEQFYAEVKRTTKEGALIAVLGYGLIAVSPEVDEIIGHFYKNVIGPYWDAERRYIDEDYATIPFPFAEIATPAFEQKLQWTVDHLLGYLNTWSAVKHFIKAQGYNPVNKLQQQIIKAWGNEQEREVLFPILLRVGKVK